MPDTVPEISSKRLRTLLEGINGFGFNRKTGGYNRVGFSDADTAVREWFGEQMVGDGLAVHSDAVGNVFGRYGPLDGPCILAGSHLDTVPEGGAFDGALGCAVALESVRAMREAGLEPATAVEVVATAEEEGRFGGMLGSQAITGRVSPEWIDAATDANGVRLVDAMREQGLAPENAGRAAREPAEIVAFLELHVEQGPVLESAGKAIGIAEAVSGVCNLAVTFTGVSNHSGTTPMDQRRDAFAGLAAFAAGVSQIIPVCGTASSRVTIGKVSIEPNHPHTVPGLAECIVNIRDVDEAAMTAMAEEVRRRAARQAGAHGLELAIAEKSWLSPVRLDPGLVDKLRTNAERLGFAHMTMPSGAGHDAQTMQSICPSGLIFVPSRDGISHSPAEKTDWADIEKGAQLYLETLCQLTMR